jgi:membrane-associated phospholipid phosphatase
MNSLRRAALSCLLLVSVGAPLQAQSLQPPDFPTAGEISGDAFLPTDSSAFELGDGRRTLGAFPRNLGRNMIGVFSRDSLAPFLIGAAAAGSGSFLDNRAVSYFEKGRARKFGDVGQTMGKASIVVPIAASMFVAGRASTDSRFRALTYDIAQVTLVNAAYTTALKHAVHRTRPNASDNLSFPSGHTSNAFAWAAVTHHHYGPKLGVPAYLVASAIGVSRMERNVHHLSDVLAGATLGYVIGRTVAREDGERQPHSKRFSIVPEASPRGDGVGLGVSLDF